MEAGAGQAERIHVYVRIRDESKTSQNGICATSNKTIRLEHSDVSPGVAHIAFDQVLTAQATQNDVFKMIQAPVDDAFDGYSSAFVSCGKEESGKTYTVHGTKAQPGLIQHTTSYLFQKQQNMDKGHRCRISMRYISISNDQVRDLSSDVRCSAVPEAFLKLPKHRVNTATEALEFYRLCHPKDTVHTAFSILLETETPTGSVSRAELLFLDVHGSAILDQAVSSPREVDLALRRSGFSSDKALSVLFGDCMKGNWKTHLLVMLRRPVLYQQQAIQTLLYACKVKDMSTRVYPVVEHRLLKTKCQDPTAEMLLQCLDYPRKEDSMIEMLSRVFGTDTVRSDEIELSLCEFRDRQAMKIDQLERDLRAAEFHRKRIEQTTRDDMRNGSNTASELGALKKSIQELVSQVPLHFRPKDSINSFDILSHAITLGTEESIKKEKCMSKIASLKQELVIVHESLQEEMDRIKLQQLQVKRPPPAFDQHMNEFSKRLDQAMEEAREIVELRDDEIKRLNESKRELSATIESQHESLSEMVGYLRHLTPEQDVDTLPNGFTDLLFTLKQSYEDLVSQMEKYRQTNQENSDYITELESDRSKEELNDENKRIRQEVVEYREKMTKMEELEKDLTRTIQSQEDSLREMLNVLGIESQVEFSPLLFVLRDSYQALQHQVWVVKGALEASQHQTFELESQLQELESKYQLICSKMEEKEMQIVTRAMRHVKRKYKDQLNEKEVKIGELQGELEKIRVKYNEMEDSISRANENETKALHRVEELQNEMNQMEKFQDRHTKQVSNSKSECFELLMSNQVTEGHNRRLQVQLMEANVLIQQKEAELHKKQLEIEHYRDNNHEY